MTASTRSDAGDRCESGACVQVDVYAGEHLTEPVVRVLSTATDTRMQLRISEWLTFVDEIRRGDWDHVTTDYEFATARAAAAKMTFEPDPNPARDEFNAQVEFNARVDAAQFKAR